MTRSETLRMRASAKRAEAKRIIRKADAFADSHPGSFVTGGSGRSRSQNRGSERALAVTINAAVRATKLRNDADDLDRRARNIEHAGEIAAEWTIRRNERVAAQKAERAASRAMSLKERLFVGVYPTCLVYCDCSVERNGDFLTVARLYFSDLSEKVYEESSPLMPAIRADMDRVKAMSGQDYKVSECGQTVTIMMG